MAAVLPSHGVVSLHTTRKETFGTGLSTQQAARFSISAQRQIPKGSSGVIRNSFLNSARKARIFGSNYDHNFGGNVQALRAKTASLNLHAVPKSVSIVCSVAAAGSGDTAGDAAEEVEDKAAATIKTVQLGCLFGLWYLFNIYFNIYNKQVLKVFPYPVTITTVQFLVGSVVVLFMWGTGLYKKPELSGSQLMGVLPLAAVHTLGNLFTNMSLGKVAVSFTHTIKALEPFFSVLLSALVLGDAPTLPVVLALVPIVGGVALASATEASFNWAGFLSAMASNLTFQSRNVLSKKFMVKKDGSLDNINLFSVITVLSFLLLLPVTLLTEGVKFTPGFMASKGLNVNQVIFRGILTGVCFHSYQQVSYMILQRVSPVTHSVGNCVKRVIVIVTSVLFFKTPVSPINGVGTAIALLGVFGYSRVKAAKPKKA